MLCLCPRLPESPWPAPGPGAPALRHFSFIRKPVWGDKVKQHPRAEAPWMTSARDLTHISLTVFCLPSQPKQGHEIEQGTAVPAVLSPSQGIALQAPTPLLSGSRHCTKPSHQSQQHAPAFTPAPWSRESQELHVH